MANVGVQPSSQGLFPPGQYPTPTMTVWHQKALCIQIWSTMVDCQRKGPFSASKCSRMFGSKKKDLCYLPDETSKALGFQIATSHLLPILQPSLIISLPVSTNVFTHGCRTPPNKLCTTLWSTTELRVRQIILFE